MSTYLPPPHRIELTANNKFVFCFSADDQSYCEKVWDGVICWNETKAGETASHPCPDYYMNIFDISRKKVSLFYLRIMSKLSLYISFVAILFFRVSVYVLEICKRTND